MPELSNKELLRMPVDMSAGIGRDIAPDETRHIVLLHLVNRDHNQDPATQRVDTFVFDQRGLLVLIGLLMNASVKLMEQEREDRG